MDDVLADDNRTLVHFPHMIGRTVHDQKNIGTGFTGTFCGFGKPDILTDRYPEPGSLDVKYQRFLSRCEIAFFVKNSVIGQFLFEIGADDGSVCQYRARVVTKPVADAMVADKNVDVVQFRQFVFQSVQLELCRRMEAVLEQEIFRRITCQRQFRREYDIGTPAAAWRANWAMRSRLPGRSPTVLLIWAMATLGDMMLYPKNGEWK